MDFVRAESRQRVTHNYVPQAEQDAQHHPNLLLLLSFNSSLSKTTAQEYGLTGMT
jgi:hypothetical protein